MPSSVTTGDGQTHTLRQSFAGVTAVVQPCAGGQREAAWPETIGPWRLLKSIAENPLTTLFLAQPLAAAASSPCFAVRAALGRSPADPLAIALLRRELAVLREVRHWNLATIIDRNVDSPQPYLVFPLAGRIAHDATTAAALPFSPAGMQRALWRIRQAACAVACLHRAGWIHGRLAPEAMLVSVEGHVTLHELGWARRAETDECEAGELLAADVRYVAPEMILPRATITALSDVYALGLMLFEWLAGRNPLADDRPWRTALNQLRTEPPDVRELRVDAPPKLARLLREMVAKEPLRRPSAEEVVRRLVRLEIELLASRGRAAA